MCAARRGGARRTPLQAITPGWMPATCTIPSKLSSCPPRNAFAAALPVSEFVLTPAERVFLGALPLERVLASKRAAKRPKDLAQIPMLEAALAVKTAKEGRE